MLIMPKRPRGGFYIEHTPQGPVFHKNTLLKTGAEWMLRSFFRGEAVTPATYYLGLTSAGYVWNSTLAAVAAGEPAGGTGYARQPLTKNTIDWTVQEVNGVMQVLSKIVLFTATGLWSQNWQRMFICDAAAGTVGNVVSVSGPAPTPRVVNVGTAPSIQYTYYLRG